MRGEPKNPGLWWMNDEDKKKGNFIHDKNLTRNVNILIFKMLYFLDMSSIDLHFTV